MESLMDTLVDCQTNNNAGRFPFSAPTYAQARCFFGGLVRAMYRLEAVGADRLPVTGPIVIAPNHDSVLDGIILGAAISRDLRFLGKTELWQSRLLGWVLDGLGAVGIKRGHGDHLALAWIQQALEAGQAVAIFPQGAIYGDRMWHRGAVRMALVTGAPLVPVRLIGTARALSRGRIGFPRLRVIIRRADQSRAGAGRAGCGDEVDRTVACRRRIAGLARPISSETTCFSSKWSGKTVAHCAHPTRAFVSPSLEGADKPSFTARIERPPFHRGGSASKKDIWPLPVYLHLASLTLKRRAWLNPRTARVQRGPSEAARCASKGDQPGPPLITSTSQSSHHPRLLPDLPRGIPSHRASLSSSLATTL
jgi:1-acyl-sn-glycerol-3-phosphate acyltransferase